MNTMFLLAPANLDCQELYKEFNREFQSRDEFYNTLDSFIDRWFGPDEAGIIDEFSLYDSEMFCEWLNDVESISETWFIPLSIWEV